LKDDEYGNNLVITCLHCQDAPCINVCPVSSLKHNEDNVVVVDANTCIGCGSCIEACPIGALYLDEVSQTIFKCDLCGGDPNCVKICSRKAIVLMDQEINPNERIKMRDEIAEQKLIKAGNTNVWLDR
jgi:Fe-S-cluster-containing dehydrogenase component